MAGVFEIAAAGDESYFFRLTAPDGTVVAVSPLFNTIKGAAAGITAVRENAATGLVVDRSAGKAAGNSAAGAAKPDYQRPDNRRAVR
ncbi:YegP family protein [uncultured Arthrobacter sp.]|uniref:YegP family protein n=1 Tax=uncultured Arthrobacter sp. TaxID=114050 RepID=UPI0032178D9C